MWMEGQKGLKVSWVVCDTFCLELAGFSQTAGTIDGAGMQDCFLFPLLCVCALGKLNIPDSLQSYEMADLKIFCSAGNWTQGLIYARQTLLWFGLVFSCPLLSESFCFLFSFAQSSGFPVVLCRSRDTQGRSSLSCNPRDAFYTCSSPSLVYQYASVVFL